MRRAPRVFWGPRWHPVPWGIPSSWARGRPKRPVVFRSPNRSGKESWGNFNQLPKQTEAQGGNEVPAPPPDPTPPAQPPPHGVCWAQHPRAVPGQTPWQHSHHYCPVVPVQHQGQLWGSHSPCSPGVQLWPRTLQQPLDEAFAVVGNEDFVCQRRKLGWNLQEESLSRMAKNYYISFPEGASNCAGTQQCVPERHKRGEYPKVILGEGSLSWEEFGNSQTPLPASVCS